MKQWATGVAAAVAVLVATVLVGAQVFAGPGSPTPRVTRPSPASPSSDGGNQHSKAVHAWVKCKAEQDKQACPKPVPPGRARAHAKHAGVAPGPASSDGHGHGWGRAHAPGQLKDKTSDDAEDPGDDE